MSRAAIQNICCNSIQFLLTPPSIAIKLGGMDATTSVFACSPDTPLPHGCLMLTDHIMIMINVQLKVELKGGVDDIREVQ
jgi:hypothetical protein